MAVPQDGADLVLPAQPRKIEMHSEHAQAAMLDQQINARLLRDYERDLESSKEITLEAWKRRPWWERLLNPVAWILERQQ